MNKVKPLPVVTSLCLLIFVQAYLIQMNTNFGKTPLAKRTTKFISDFLPKLPIILLRNLPD